MEDKQLVVDLKSGSIYLKRVESDEVQLRIGGSGQGEGRNTTLTARQARIVAYALLAEAEKMDIDTARDEEEGEKARQEVQKIEWLK